MFYNSDIVTTGVFENVVLEQFWNIEIIVNLHIIYTTFSLIPLQKRCEFFWYSNGSD